nr:hypothetical protein [Stenotrophomonas indicatrix]
MLKNSPLLAELQKAGKFDIHSLENRVFLPANPRLADLLGVTPHSGGPLSAYQAGMLDRLNRIQMAFDGQASLDGDLAAMDRVVRRVEQLRGTVKVGLINGDLSTNTPVGSTPELTNQRCASPATFQLLPDPRSTDHCLEGLQWRGPRLGCHRAYPAAHRHFAASVPA